MLIWLKKNGDIYGGLEKMEWLLNTECPWSVMTFSWAAKHGSLKIMKWLKLNGCPWNEDTFAFAAELGDLKNLKWLKRHGCPMPYRLSSNICRKDETITAWLKTTGFHNLGDYGFIKIKE